MGERIRSMPSLLDREISSTDADSFGHRHFAKALQSLIESPVNEPPFSIGLLGKWGTGKSSIKELYLSSLKDDLTRNKQEKTRSQRFHAITFNAWRFGGENIKRALLRHVFLELGGDEASLKDALFRQIERTALHKRDWGDVFREAIDKYGWSLLQVGLVFGFIIGFLYSTKFFFGLSNEWVIGSLTAIFAIISIPILKYLLDPKRLLIQRYSNITRIETPSTCAEEYEDLLIAQLKKFKEGSILSKKGRNCERIVIFVDDLDRLSPEEMISGLDAVRTFMEIQREQLPAGLWIVFVISCDEGRVADALADRRRRRITPDLPGAVFNRSDARRFLDRIFQFRLEIPQFPKRDMRNFSMKRLINDMAEIAEDLRNRGVPLENIIDRMIHVNVSSPRNALQILNTFAQSWWLARERERDGAGTERPGGLQQGCVTDHPISLAALSALRVDFPDFYGDLQTEPDLINRFTEVFIRGSSLEDQPELTRNILQNYLDSEKKDLKTQHRPLRQYIASLQGLRWPPTLQPLLLLSQDPVTRKFGDKSLRLFQSFVSGDHQGVLIELGKDKDAKPLSSDDVRLLYDMQEELQRETDVRRNNAAAVIAALSERLPEDQAHFLLSPLARRLAESPELRWRLGISKIQNVLPHALADDRREVAWQLIKDLLRPEEEIDFRLESGEPPSLDEAIEMSRQACDLVLWVKQKDGLATQSDSQLISWLEVRRVAVGNKEYQMPFSDLEDWMAKYEEMLIVALKGRYTKLVAAQLQSDRAKDLDIDAIMHRSRIVFQKLWDAGEDSRPELWKHLNAYISVKTEEAARLAWEFMGLHVNGPDSLAFTTFVKNFAERVNKNMKDTENWKLDGESGSLSLLNMIEKRRDDIVGEAQQSLGTLAISWSETDETGEFAIRLLTCLLDIDKERAGEVVTQWSGRVLSDLPRTCIKWLGNQFDTNLTNEQQTHLASHLNEILQPSNVTEEKGGRYQLLLGQISKEAVETDAMQKHLRNLLSQIPQHHNNPNNYLYNVFPSIPKLIESCPKPQTGEMLHGLFSNAAGAPEILGWLHHQMAEHWPEQAQELNPYNPQQLFKQAISSAQNSPNNSGAPGILRSVREMVKNRIVDKTNASKVLQIACTLWPYHQGDSIEAFMSFQQVPEPALIANLTDGINPEEQDECNGLLKAWLHMSGILEGKQKIAITKQILGETPKGTDQEPDLCLRLWIEAQRENRTDLIRHIVLGEDINDDQRKRIWLQTERILPDLGKDFLISILPKIFEVQDSPETMRAIFEAENGIDRIFSSTSDRYDLGKILLKAFISTSSQETKNKLAVWINKIDAVAVLKELESMGKPTEEDIEILEEHFPKSKYLIDFRKSDFERGGRESEEEGS